MMWEAGLRESVWQDIRALFTHQKLPPLMAVRFLAQHGKELVDAEAITAQEQFNILQVGPALIVYWASAVKASVPEEIDLGPPNACL